MMLTVREMLQLTAGHRKKLLSNATEVSVAFQRPKEGRDERGYYRGLMIAARTAKPGKKTKRVELRFYYPEKKSAKSNYIPPEFRIKDEKYLGPKKPPQLSLSSHVWMRCSCEYFLYHCEVADHGTNNADIKYSNGRAPVITNPREIPHCCKHIIAALRKGALLKK